MECFQNSKCRVYHTIDSGDCITRALRRLQGIRVMAPHPVRCEKAPVDHLGDVKFSWGNDERKISHLCVDDVLCVMLGKLCANSFDEWDGELTTLHRVP